MSVINAPVEVNWQEGEMLAYPMGANATIYKGQLVVTRGDGYAYPLRAPGVSQADVFVGIADETVTNVAGTVPSYVDGNPVTGSAGAVNIRVRTRGVVTVQKASAALSDIGTTLFYGADANTVSATSTNAVAIGYAVQTPVDSSHLRIRIDLQVV